MVPFVVLCVVFSIVSFLLIVYVAFDGDLWLGLWTIAIAILRFCVAAVLAFLTVTLAAYLFDTAGGDPIPASSMAFLQSVVVVALLTWWVSMRVAVYPIVGAVVAVIVINVARLRPPRGSLVPTLLVLVGVLVVVLVDRRLFWLSDADAMLNGVNPNASVGDSGSSWRPLGHNVAHDWGYNDDDDA